MKKLIFINVALVALAMFVSCQKEQFTKIVTDTKGVTEFTASIYQPTKTVIDATGKVTWAAGDEITVIDANSNYAVYVAQYAGASTKFILKEGETAVGDGPYTAAYRNLSSQVYDAAGANCPLTAPETSTTNFTFSSPYAVVKLTAKSEAGEVIKSVGVTYGENNSTLDCGDGVTLTSEGIDFYVAVQPSAEAATLSVTFYTDEKKATKERAGEVTLAAKDLLPVTFNSFTWVNKVETFKAVYNTKGDANTLRFYYNGVDYSGEGITVYEDGTDTFLFDDTKANGAKWGYNEKRGEIKSVEIDASVAGYKGLTSTASMFQSMTTATNISGAEYLDVSNVTDMSCMFQNFGGGANGNPTTLNSVPNVSGWNTGNVTNMTAMFESYGNFSDNLAIVPDVSNWNTGNVTDMAYMFQKYGHESQNFNAVPDVSNWNTGNVTNMANIFYEYGHKSTALNTVPNVSGWNTDKVTNMKQMFNNYGSTSENISCVLDLSGWDLSNITGTNGGNVFNFNPKTFDVTIPAKTGEKSNEGGVWYYGDGTNSIAPPTDKTFTILPAGALKGEFSVSGTKKVHFSKGNLVATIDASGVPSDWKFATNQYDYIGEGGANKTIGVAAGDVDLFGWSTASTTYGISTSTSTSSYSGDFVDWGKAYCEKNNITPDNTWRTLSEDEWTYLFNTRTVNGGTGAGKSCSLNITFGGKMGVVLYPDDYTGSVLSGTVDSLPEGVVFLPAAGYRSGSGVDYVGGLGFYWSSTANGSDGAYYVSFSSGYVDPNYDNRTYGFSVRLVTEVPAE